MRNVYVVVFVQAGLWHCSLESHLSVSTPAFLLAPRGRPLRWVCSSFAAAGPGMFPSGAGGMSNTANSGLFLLVEWPRSRGGSGSPFRCSFSLSLSFTINCIHIYTFPGVRLHRSSVSTSCGRRPRYSKTPVRVRRVVHSREFGCVRSWFHQAEPFNSSHF